MYAATASAGADACGMAPFGICVSGLRSHILHRPPLFQDTHTLSPSRVVQLVRYSACDDHRSPTEGRRTARE